MAARAITTPAGHAAPRPRLSAEALRKRDLAMIHLAVKQCGLSREDYEHVLRVRFGATSSGALDVRQRGELLKHFELLGFKRRHKTGGKTEGKPGAAAKLSRPMAMDDESRKVRALWLMLHEIGVVRDPSEEALAAYVKRIAKVDALQWARGEGVYDVIETLKKWAMRYLPTLVRDLAVVVGAARAEGTLHIDQDIAQRLQATVTLAQQRGTFDPMLDAWEALRAVAPGLATGQKGPPS